MQVGLPYKMEIVQFCWSYYITISTFVTFCDQFGYIKECILLFGTKLYIWNLHFSIKMLDNKPRLSQLSVREDHWEIFGCFYLTR